MKLLYIGEKQIKRTHGWEHINYRNQKAIEMVFEEVKYMPLEYNTLKSKLCMFVTDRVIHAVLCELKNEYDCVFIRQSLLGRLCKAVKKHYPNLKVITFFHNIERQYGSEYFRISGMKALPYYILASIWEKIAVNNTDYFIVLNSRDANLLNSIYGVHANSIMPTTLEDKFVISDSLSHEKEIVDYLFVGAAFYANLEGMQWFIDKVMPFVSGKLLIVGKGMSPEKFVHVCDNIQILGYVDDLSSLYKRAKYVVSPIFSGGGMKTKTAEALMFGKKIIGTKEAFEGYEIDSRVMIECNNADEYIQYFNNNKDETLFHKLSRKVFLEKYDLRLTIKEFEKVKTMIQR